MAPIMKQLKFLCPGDPSWAGSRAAPLASILHSAQGPAQRKRLVKQLFGVIPPPRWWGTIWAMSEAQRKCVEVGGWLTGFRGDVQNV